MDTFLTFFGVIVLCVIGIIAIVKLNNGSWGSPEDDFEFDEFEEDGESDD